MSKRKTIIIITAQRNLLIFLFASFLLCCTSIIAYLLYILLSFVDVTTFVSILPSSFV